MSDLMDRIATLRSRIEIACDRSGRLVSDIELLPVSKRQPIGSVQQAMALGFQCFGENYVQEGVRKAAELPTARFRLIGPLQRNKAKAALTHFEAIMTLDRPELALRLRQLAQEENLNRPIWIQLELWGEASKQGGCAEPELPALLAALADDPRLPLQGFLAIPPPGMDQAFHSLAELRNKWQDRLGKKLKLSMGMSDDLEAAIQAGSDQVRIGTDFFGERNPSV